MEDKWTKTKPLEPLIDGVTVLWAVSNSGNSSRFFLQ
jgi:hypothetical protein